ncbi:EthD family reductase [Marinobacterium litorale]|uniref:EthD family reductase n=1 Tax=Marinobacterium litorale TaxID=404770 RepID=UPI000483B824|nr:EthD family reductase [Marinobacterium litorale]
MKKLMVLYPEPENRSSFLEYYRVEHLPMVKKLPGLVSAAFSVTEEEGSPYFVFFEAVFENIDALHRAMSSATGEALAQDVPNFSPQGAVIVTADLEVIKPEQA